MLFNSPEFVLGFLPVALVGFFLAGRVGGTHWALRWLVAASLSSTAGAVKYIWCYQDVV
jgi:alginate O-acetyltransferase complex protein AlgI